MGLSTFQDFTNNSNGGNGSGGSGNGSSSGGLPPIPGLSMSASAPDDDERARAFLIDYNKQFATCTPAKFRDGVIDQTMAVLAGMFKPNAMLVGPAGVGKTKIVEEIARRLATKDATVPASLANYNVFELPLSNLVAGASFVGQLEENVKAVVAFAEKETNNVILFIDEIHLLGESQGSYGKIAQILKPALARGRMRVIGATTTAESSDIADDPALNRRFSRVIVDELTRDQTIEVISDLWPSMYAHYKAPLVTSQELFETVTLIADQFATAGSHRPDNAITLLDRTIADAVVDRRRQEAAAAKDPTLQAALAATPDIYITDAKLRRTARKIMTGHATLDTPDATALDAAFSAVRGQDEAMSVIKDLILKRSRNLFPDKRPLTCMLLGASGTGKTMAARIVGDVVTHSKPIILNMTEYNSPASINRIIGSSAGYVGYDSKAELPFDCLESNPYQVILLDEFEKCDPAVQRLFMSVFDEGSLTTSKGKVIDFSKAIIFATTNAGQTNHKKASIGFTDEKTSADDVDLSSLSNWFDLELLNRFTRIFTFNDISRETYIEVLRDIYKRESTRIMAEHPRISLPSINDDTLNELADKSYKRAFGARPAERTIRDYIEEIA